MITRRKFLAVAALAVLFGFAGNTIASEKRERAISLYNIHTEERLDVKYCSSGVYDQDALDRINYLMRCHYTNTVKPIDIGVIDLLCDIKDDIGTGKEISVISGYRSPEYNEYLHEKGRGVACHSLHLEGRAIDFRLPGVDSPRLARLAKSFFAGGVGKYHDFVHVDTGRIRYW